MASLIFAILVASLLGSLHCAGMCGPFAVIAAAPAARLTVGGRDQRKGLARLFEGQVSLQAAYHGGRLVTYVTLGAIAGGVGSAMDFGGAMIGVQRTAMILAAGFMVGFGVIGLARAGGWWPTGLTNTACSTGRLGPLTRLAQRAHRAAMALRPVHRAAAIGLLTTLLPCGWLYAFVIAAVGTAHPLRGAAAMAAFWLGTLPVLVAVGASVRAITGPMARRLPSLTAGLLIFVGALTLGERLWVSNSAFAGITLPGAAASSAEQIKAIEALDSGEMPCCALGKGKRAVKPADAPAEDTPHGR